MSETNDSKNSEHNLPPKPEAPAPEDVDSGWHDWKERNYVIHPWTQEVHRMREHCDCERYGQPTHKLTPEQAAGFLDGHNMVAPGECIKVLRLLMLANEECQ